jgi:glycosyltransferase involved in cell wall biosynthesis/SAM-dependent methyltransferase
MFEVDRRLVFGESSDAAERIAPGFFPEHVEAEHVARYRWAMSAVRGRSVLDVACGTGYGSAMLLHAGARSVRAVDVSAAALDFARKTYAGPAYVRADALTLPFRGSSVDVVVSLETIEHLVDERRFLQGLRALLRTGGELLVSSPNVVLTHNTNPYHVHEMTLDELQELLRSAGFRVTDVRGQYWRLGPRRGIWRLGGFGRLAFYISQAHRVWRLPRRLGFQPLYWCVRAVADGPRSTDARSFPSELPALQRLGETDVPFVSIVVPTRNRATRLAHCLRSLREQRYPKDRYEIVVVDDGSVDATAEIVERCAADQPPLVRYVPRPAGGVNAARNSGIAAATGDPICLVDDDQEMPPEWLPAIVDATLRYPEAGCVGGPVRLRFEAPPPRICEMESWSWEWSFDLGPAEHVVEHVTGGNLAMRRWALEVNGHFDASLSGLGDDVEWVRRLTKAKIPSVYIPSAWLWHRRTRADLRWTTLLRRRFRQGREWVTFARFNGESPALWPLVWPIPFYLLHALRRRCFGAMMDVARKLGMAWGILRTRAAVGAGRPGGARR